jgi:hypothetical protein
MRIAMVMVTGVRTASQCAYWVKACAHEAAVTGLNGLADVGPSDILSSPADSALSFHRPDDGFGGEGFTPMPNKIFQLNSVLEFRQICAGFIF